MASRNSRPNTAVKVKETLAVLKWKVLSHPPYSPDIAPSDYYLFRSMQSGLAEQHFGKVEEIEKLIDKWIDSKNEDFFHRGIHKLPERWSKVVAAQGNYFH